MNLRTALSVYTKSGPHGFAHGRTTEATATKLLYFHLNATEIASLDQAWKKVASEGTRGPFEAALATVKQRLINQGYL